MSKCSALGFFSVIQLRTINDIMLTVRYKPSSSRLYVKHVKKYNSMTHCRRKYLSCHGYKSHIVTYILPAPFKFTYKNTIYIIKF